MSDEYGESIERTIEHLRDGDHAAAYVGTLEPEGDGSDFEIMSAVDSERVDSSGAARLELLAHHVLMLSKLTDLTPHHIAVSTADIIEQSEQFDAHDIKQID